MFSLFPFRLPRRTLHLRVIATALGALTLFGPASAIAVEWRLEKISGDVRVFGVGEQWVEAQPKQVLKAGESVWTGRRSRAQIATDDGTVILSSRSLVKVPAQALPDGTKVLLQGQGEVRAKVKKRQERHFSIQTPFLAAVVKGTEFTVKAGSSTRSVNVHDGQVGAVSVTSGQTVDINAGQSLSTSNARSGSLGAPSSGGSEGAGQTGDNDPVDGNRSSFGGFASAGGSGSGGGGGDSGGGEGGEGGHGGGGHH